MWQTSITNVQKQLGWVEVTVLFTDGTNSFTEIYHINNEYEVAEHVAQKLAGLARVDALFESIQVGPVSPPTPKIPTESEVYVNNLRKLSRMKELVTLGIIPQDNQEYITLVDWLKANYQSSYFN